MAVPFNAATAAYGNAAALLKGDAPGGLGAPKGQGVDFAQFLSDSLKSVADSGNAADQKVMDYVNGRTDVVDVVTAVSQTEIAIESMVAVRDRVISAYEEIMRMPI